MHDLPRRLRLASTLLLEAADEVERLHRALPIDSPERLPLALDYLRAHPEHMLYRGSGTDEWMLAGKNAPHIRFSRSEIEGAIAKGLLTPRWPEEPKVGIDCLKPVEPA